MVAIPNNLGNNVGRPTAAPKSIKKTIHLMQVSLQRTDTMAQMEHDMKYAFSQGPDVIGFTEMVGSQMRATFNRVCREHDWVPIIPAGVGLTVPLAVKLGGDADTKVRSRGAKLALPGVAKQYENRYISWVQIKWHNQNIWVHEGHWSRTKWGAERHTSVSAMMAAQVKKHGAKDAISFWMGDLNVDELDDDRATHARAAANLNTIFRDVGLLSVFDELHVNPPATLAGKGTYDVIGSYRPDKQVEGKRYKVHPKQKSDHRPVSAWFDIEVGQKAVVNLGFIGTENDPDSADPERVDPDFYATGGNIDWSDYLKDDTYPLPYAYGDSDSHRHG